MTVQATEIIPRDLAKATETEETCGHPDPLLGLYCTLAPHAGANHGSCVGGLWFYWDETT